MKVEETSLAWETMVLEELKKRLNEVESLGKFTKMLPDVYLCLRYNNVTCMLMEELPGGTLLVNNILFSILICIQHTKTMHFI